MLTVTRYSLFISISMEIHSALKYWTHLYISPPPPLKHTNSWWFSWAILAYVVHCLGITDTCLLLVFFASQLQDFDHCLSQVFWQALLFLRSPVCLHPVGNCFLGWMDEYLTPLQGLAFGQLFAAAVAAAQAVHMVVAVPAHWFHWRTPRCFHYTEAEGYWRLLAVLVQRQLAMGWSVFQDLCCIHRRVDRSQAWEKASQIETHGEMWFISES